MNDPFIECKSLTKQYKGRNKIIDAVKDISLGIEENSFVLIKGRSGAGKSTLLHLIGGLIRPTSGSVRIGNDIINELDNRSLSAILASKTGIIFQSFNLLPTYDLYENVEIALAPAGLTDNEMKRIILPCFEQFGMSDKLYSMPGELSVGQQQKVAIIRTLVKQPSIILADEPTGSVDSITAGEIFEHFRFLKNEKKVTIIMTTHGIVQETLADRIIIMEDGMMRNV